MVGRAKGTRNVEDTRKTRRCLVRTRARHSSCWLITGKAQHYVMIFVPAPKIPEPVPNTAIVGSTTLLLSRPPLPLPRILLPQERSRKSSSLLPVEVRLHRALIVDTNVKSTLGELCIPGRIERRQRGTVRLPISGPSMIRSEGPNKSCGRGRRNDRLRFVEPTSPSVTSKQCLH